MCSLCPYPWCIFARLCLQGGQVEQREQAKSLLPLCITFVFAPSFRFDPRATFAPDTETITKTGMFGKGLFDIEDAKTAGLFVEHVWSHFFNLNKSDHSLDQFDLEIPSELVNPHIDQIIQQFNAVQRSGWQLTRTSERVIHFQRLSLS